MTPGHKRQHTALKRIGILFHTSAQLAQGEAELRLQGPGGAEFAQRFSLKNLVDNTYRYFDLDPQQYTTGALLSRSDSGISTRESRTGEGEAVTCVTYEYSDGKRGFTPGCPLY